MKGIATLAMLVTVTASSITSAAVITANTADIQVNKNGSGVVSFGAANDYQARIGEYFYPGHAEYVVPFLLPTLGAGKGFTAASFQAELFDKGGTPADVDLYGVRVSSSATVLTTDDYVGTNDTSSTLIQASFFNSTSLKQTNTNTGPFTTTSSAGNTALAQYLNTAYANGANAGKYAFLRLSPEAISTGNNFYAVLTQDASETPGHPFITFTEGTVPEPASLAVIGLCGTLGLRRRRH